MSTSSSPPDGSDLFSNGSQSGTVIIVSAVLTGLSTIVVALRLYTRQFILNTAGADDWTMGLAQLLSIAAGTSTMLAVQGVLLTITCIPLASIQPSAASWCLDTLPIWEFTSIVGLITDFGIFLLPLPEIWKLPIAARQRMVLFGIFGLGFFVCIVSIIRIPTLRAASKAADPTFNNVSAALWTLTELNTAILCSSLPVLRPLVFKSTGRGSKKTITADPNHPSRQGTKGGALELTTTSSRRKPAMRSVVSGSNESSDELVTSTIDEVIYRSDEPVSRHGAGRNTAVLADDDAAELGLSVKTYIYSSSDKRDRFD
ncbi:hypothetical protein diail_4311 [Diaporthe ilicicola]|nr:hypothetical protein diail_4311 [Diaporthe ilicicola]